jgi:KDO2-lipid IV(A) lauroyltransferase
MPRAKTLRNSLLVFAVRFFYMLATLLPRTLGLWLFSAAGRGAFVFPNREKTRTIEHLRLIFGETWSENKIQMTARNVYRELGKNMFDAIYLSRASLTRFEALVRHDDFTEFKKAYDCGRGVVAITAHIGCFEMLLHFFARYGLKSFAIGRRMFDPRLEGIVRSIRSGEDIDYMGRDEGALKVVRQLKEGKIFGVLIDQDVRVEAVFADFLGRPANTPSGPMKIAMKFNIPVVVVTTARQLDNTHYVFIGKPIDLVNTGDFESDLVKNVQIANDMICTTIMRFPEQWVWMHRRWKRKPPSPAKPEKSY